MSVLYTNNASATLSASITNAATSFSVSTGQGALFPAISGSDFFYVTLTNTENTVEIVKVTARSTDAFTVVRGQEGTSALAWNSGDKVELRITKAMLDQFKTDTRAGITSSNVTTALGYTPYNSTNPNGYTTNTGTVTSVGGTGTVSGLSLSGTVTNAGNLTLGGTLSVTPSNFASQTANYVLAAPTGVAGTPTFRALVAADIPTLNQNTTGTAANVTGTVAIANGGTGQTSQQAALNALAGAVTSAQFLRGNGTNVTMSAIQASDVPTLNQNTTGTAANVTGTVAVANGGTGATTLTGIVKGNGASAFTAATAGTDYLAPPSGTSILKANSGGALANAVSGTDYQAPIGTISGIAKGNGANALTAATAGTDFVSPSVATSFTKPQRPSLSTETAPTTNTITWDLTTDQILRINLNANITTFNLTGTLSSLAGNQYQVIVRYNGGTAITWNANIKWPAGTAPTLTGTSGKVDTFTFVVSSTDGANYYLLNTGKTQNL